MIKAMAESQEKSESVLLAEDGVGQAHEEPVKRREQERLRESRMQRFVHDMRSPLMCITGSLELIRHEWETNGILPLDLWQMSVVSAQEVIGMCDNALDISRLEAGQRLVRHESCELLPSISKAVAAVQIQADLQGVVLRVEGEAARVLADKDLLHRILVNLLVNAIKYTPRSDWIVVKTASSVNDVRVEIQDSSRGIPREFHEKVFEEYGQAESKEGQKYAAGFGLLFCKLAVEAQGGRIGVDSEPGKGNTFWFMLPAGGCGCA